MNGRSSTTPSIAGAGTRTTSGIARVVALAAVAIGVLGGVVGCIEFHACEPAIGRCGCEALGVCNNVFFLAVDGGPRGNDLGRVGEGTCTDDLNGRNAECDCRSHNLYPDAGVWVSDAAITCEDICKRAFGEMLSCPD